MAALYDFEKIFMSAETGNGINDLKGWLAGKMPASRYLFDPDDLSDMLLVAAGGNPARKAVFEFASGTALSVNGRDRQLGGA